MRLKRTGPDEYTEILGMDYEDFEVGATIHHRPGRTITEADNTWLTLLLMNRHPIHFNRDYAEKSAFGRILVNSSVTLAMVGGMTVASLSARTIANLGWDEVRLPAPVFVGDTLYASSTIVHKRLSRSRPGEGIVTVKTWAVNQDGVEVIRFQRSFLVREGTVMHLDAS